MPDLHDVIAALHRAANYGPSVDDAATVEEWLFANDPENQPASEKPASKTTTSKEK
jgi:hypothetical protein